MEGGAEVPSLFEVLLTHSLETKGTDWDMLHALLRAAVEEKALQVGRPAGMQRRGRVGVWGRRCAFPGPARGGGTRRRSAPPAGDTSAARR